MAIIVEDGNLISGANSYVSPDEVKKFADDRGIIIPTGDELDQRIIKSFDYIESFDYRGRKTTWDQSTKFPRQDLVVDGYRIPSNVIPQAIKNAQMQAVLTLEDVDNFDEPISTGAVISETVDVISTSYAEPQVSNSGRVVYPMIDAYLKDYIGGSMYGMRTVRA